MPLVLWTLPFVATGVARPHASVAVLTVTSQVTAAVNPLRGGVVGPIASGATPLSEHAAARPLTRVAARASFSRRGMGHLGMTPCQSSPPVPLSLRDRGHSGRTALPLPRG